MEMSEALEIIHRINLYKQPLPIANMLTFPNRIAKPIVFNLQNKKSKYDKNIFIQKAVPYYNNLRIELKTLNWRLLAINLNDSSINISCQSCTISPDVGTLQRYQKASKKKENNKKLINWLREKIKWKPPILNAPLRY